MESANRSKLPEPMKVLLVDWQHSRLETLCNCLVDERWELTLATSLSGVRYNYELTAADAIIMPLAWPSHRSGQPEPEVGFRLMDSISALPLNAEIIVFDDYSESLEASKYCRPFLYGASAFLDSNSRTFIEDIRKCLERRFGIRGKLVYSQRQNTRVALKSLFESLGVVGESRVMIEVFEQIYKAALMSDIPVLLLGETGTGKQLFAEAIHKLDEKRRNHPFLTINCSAISSTLAESALFGHKKGAFTGATDARMGYFRAANHGTLFLDEIGEMDLSLQPKLLRILEYNRVLPIGADTELEVDVRVIAASNRDLRALVSQGRFRLDLYHRLNVYPVTLPRLKERPEDLLPLIKFFARKHNYDLKDVDPRVIEVLSALDLDGNLRELENIIRRIICVKQSGGGSIEIKDLPKDVIRSLNKGSMDEKSYEERLAQCALQKMIREKFSLSEMVDYWERLILELVLREANGNRELAARLLRTTVRTIFNKIQKHRLCTMKVSSL